MVRLSLVAAVAAAAIVVPATASADNTPPGAATFTVGSEFSCGGIAYFGQELLVAWQATVADGGQGGIVRPTFGSTLGDAVELPAAAGTYTFPAPHIPWFPNCVESTGLVQLTGDHALLARDAPGQFLTVSRDGQPDERIDGARLAVRAFTEHDWDKDMLGETTEDRTDLRIAAKATRETDGRARVEATVTNAGPLAADLPRLTTTSLAGARWQGACSPTLPYPGCVKPRMAAGERRVFVLRGDMPGAVTGTVGIAAEGPDLMASDNTAAVTLPRAPAFDLVVRKKQHLSQGLKVQVRGVREGRARLTVAFMGSGRTIKIGRVIKLTPYKAKNVTVQPAGAKLRSLRRMLASGNVSAAITARTFSGKATVTAKATLTR